MTKRQFNTLTGFLTSKSSNITTDSTAEFQGYDTIGDGGDATWKHNGVTGQTVSQSPAQLGDALLNDGNGNQWALIGTSRINPRALGAKFDGVSDDYLPFLAAASTGLGVAIPDHATVELSQNITVGDELFVGLNVIFNDPSKIQSPQIQDKSILSNTATMESYANSADGNSFGRYVTFSKSGVQSADSESDGLLVISTSHLDASTHAVDVVGVGGRSYIPSSNTDGRVWGMNAYARIFSGGDGQCVGIEVDVDNGGTDNSIPDTNKAKYGVNVTSKSGNPITAAYRIGSSSQVHYGFWAAPSCLVSSTSSFIELEGKFAINGSGRASFGTDVITEVTRTFADAGRCQHQIESSGVGAESATRYTKTGAANWTVGQNFDTERFLFTTGANLYSGNEILTLQKDGNVGINGYQPAGGIGVVFLGNATTAPTGNPTGGGVFFVEAGALKYKGSSGTVTTIAPA